jgi:hypothetical protein
MTNLVGGDLKFPVFRASENAQIHILIGFF